MQNKKKKIITAIIILALVLIAFIVFAPSTSDNAHIQPEEEDLSEEEIATQLEECAKQTSYFQAKCYSDLAYAAKDPDICDKVEDIQDTGYGDSYYMINKGLCLGYTASELGYDYSLCDRVADNEEYYGYCERLIAINESEDTRDPSVCDRVSDDTDAFRNCITMAITKEDELYYCDEVTDESEREFCLDLGYANIALVQEDVTYCDKINSSVEKSICIGSYAEEYEQLELCNGLTSDQDICVCYNMYFEELDDEACSSLSDTAQQETCNMCQNISLYQSY